MISIEDLRSGDEEAAHRLGRQAFGGTHPFDPDRAPIGEGRHVAAYLDGALVGQVRRHAFGQYFGGRRLGCAGISGVVVAPQARSRNVARRMLTESLDRAAADGEVIAALYPTTAALYRSVGFEVAGWWAQLGMPLATLPRDDGTLTWEPADFDDPRWRPIYDRMAADHDGWLDLPPDFWERWATDARKDERANRYCYIGVRAGEPVAALRYVYADSDQAMYRIDAEAILGVDGAAVAAALAFLGANGTTAAEVRTLLPVDELGLHLDHVQRVKTHMTWPWMLAFIDLPGAIAARGYPEGVAGTLALRVHDPSRPANDGSWLLSVAEGAATLERDRGRDSTVEVTTTDLAALFSGYLDPLRLARSGRLGHPAPRDVDLLRAALAGQPSLTIFF